MRVLHRIELQLDELRQMVGAPPDCRIVATAEGVSVEWTTHEEGPLRAPIEPAREELAEDSP